VIGKTLTIFPKTYFSSNAIDPVGKVLAAKGEISERPPTTRWTTKEEVTK
jgi:hypothetical protein